MPLTKELEIKANEDIINAINDLIDRYLREGVSIYDMKKYFKPNRIFNVLLKDIHYAGRRYFEEGEDYPDYVRKVFNDVVLDRISEIETKKIQQPVTERKIIKFDNFLNESINFDDLSLDYLFNELEYSEKDMDIIADYFKTRKEYITSKNPKYSTYSVTDFKVDILKNNRTGFDVLLLSDNQIIKMIKNTVRYIISGVYSQIPEEIEYLGVRVKPHTVIDKVAIKEAIEKLIKKDDIINHVTKISGYEFESNFGEYYIWKKLK